METPWATARRTKSASFELHCGRPERMYSCRRMIDVEVIGDEIATLAARVSAATHRLLTCIRQFDEAEGWHRQGAQSCAHWLTWRIGLDPVTAREKVRVARALGGLPKIDEAFRSGRLSYAQARAVTRVATATNEGCVLDIALACTGAQLERI